MRAPRGIQQGESPRNLQRPINHAGTSPGQSTTSSTKVFLIRAESKNRFSSSRLHMARPRLFCYVGCHSRTARAGPNNVAAVACFQPRSRRRGRPLAVAARGRVLRRATIHGAESREQTTSPCKAAAAEIATPLKHRTRPRDKFIEWVQRSERQPQQAVRLRASPAPTAIGAVKSLAPTEQQRTITTTAQRVT